jgi:type III secretory pathway component EscV
VGLTFQFRVGYTNNAMDTTVTRAELEHVLRTMLQITSDAYYRAIPFTESHNILGEIKRMLEAGITALQQLSENEHAVEESAKTHANS